MYHTIANGKVWHDQIKNRAKDGSFYWVDTTIVPTTDEDGKLVRYIAIRADISDRKRAEDALKESLAISEAKSRELAIQKFALDQHAIVAMTDVQGTITYVNEKFCKISQYSKEELIGKNHRILNSGHHPKEFFQHMYHTIANGKVWHDQIKNRAKDGSFYWVDTTIVPTADEDGKAVRYIAIRADISDRKRVEDALKESLATSEAASRELADQKFALDQHAIVAVTDVQGTITHVNQKFCEISQYSQEELIGKNHRILNSGHHPKEFFQQMYHTIAKGEVWRGEIKNHAKDGSFYWVDTTIVPFMSGSKAHQYVAIRTDITERKRGELMRERLAAELVESSDDAIISKTLDGTITTWNRGAERMFGYSPAEAIGKSINLILPQDRINEESDILAHIGRGESIDHFDTVRVRKDGERIHISVAISPMRNTAGKVVGASKIARDITRAKADEREIRKLNEELERRNQVLERSNIELQQFAYIASHDLQSPLRSVSGFIQLLKKKYEDQLDEQAFDWIRRAVQATGQMQTLIRDLLAFSRVDSRARPFVLMSFQDVFNDAVNQLEPSIRDAGGQVTCGQLPQVIGDRSQLVQLMDNLNGNGLKYHGEKVPHVHVSAEQIEHSWTFSVRDNGIGIAPEHYERIFEIFQRLHDKRDYPGTGIGLAVCRRIVGRHGGTIWVESTPPRGSAFHFTIPVGTDETNGRQTYQ
jgi:PAS domain S-box-containing protein